jgi:hypothetical protein
MATLWARRAVVADLLADEAGGGPDFHAVSTPAETAVGGRVAAAEEIHPGGFLRQRSGADDLHGDVERAYAGFDLLQHPEDEGGIDGRLDEGVVADEEDAAARSSGGMCLRLSMTGWRMSRESLPPASEARGVGWHAVRRGMSRN